MLDYLFNLLLQNFLRLVSFHVLMGLRVLKCSQNLRVSDVVAVASQRIIKFMILLIFCDVFVEAYQKYSLVVNTVLVAVVGALSLL